MSAEPKSALKAFESSIRILKFISEIFWSRWKRQNLYLEIHELSFEIVEKFNNLCPTFLNPLESMKSRKHGRTVWRTGWVHIRHNLFWSQNLSFFMVTTFYFFTVTIKDRKRTYNVSMSIEHCVSNRYTVTFSVHLKHCKKRWVEKFPMLSFLKNWTSDQFWASLTLWHVCVKW